jgi:hypothetical protein
MEAAWIGVDADVVSNNEVAAAPDGAADGHFTVDLEAQGSPTLSHAAIYSSDAGGTPVGGHVWHTQPNAAWMIGIVAGGQLLHAGKVPVLGQLSPGRTRLELYAGNSGLFNPGQHFLVLIGFPDGTDMRRVVQLPGAVAQPQAPPAPSQPVAGEFSVFVPANDAAGVTTPSALEAGRRYVLEASGSYSAWGGDTEKIDAVWCYWAERCGAAGLNWEQLLVDGQGLSALSAAAGGPAPLPYDPSHVYRVTIQGQGRPITLVVADAASGSGADNSGGFNVRITPAP